MLYFKNKIIDRVDFNNDNYQNQKIVFTNGCFDLIHIGHLEYLYKARQLGDLLVIGLNSDASVSRLKGNKRPVNDFNSRASLLASLYFVDIVMKFEEDTPLNLIKIVKPNILVKGGDYKIDEIVGAEFVQKMGGNVITIPFVAGYSSTNLINKIKSL